MDPARTLPLREATDAELVEAAERMDAGCRLVVPMMMDGLGPDPEPEPIAAEFPGLVQEVLDISAALTIVECKLAYLAGAVGEGSPATAVVGRAGLTAAELREQWPTLRDAVVDFEVGS